MFRLVRLNNELTCYIWTSYKKNNEWAIYWPARLHYELAGYILTSYTKEGNQITTGQAIYWQVRLKKDWTAIQWLVITNEQVKYWLVRLNNKWAFYIWTS